MACKKFPKNVMTSGMQPTARAVGGSGAGGICKLDSNFNDIRIRWFFLNGASFFSSLQDGVRRPPALTIGRLVSKPLAAKDEP
jgi:hypothetical protein